MKVYCPKCDKAHDFSPEDIVWDFDGYGYDTKYVICPECGQANIIRYIEDKNFDVNNDERFYTYGEKKGGGLV